jgi:hypothetical protein
MLKKLGNGFAEEWNEVKYPISGIEENCSIASRFARHCDVSIMLGW